MADQVLTGGDRVLVRIGWQADEQMSSESFQRVRQGRGQARAQDLQRGTAVDLQDDVAIAPGDAGLRSKGLAALCHADGAAQITRQVQTGQGPACHVATVELEGPPQRRIARSRGPDRLEPRGGAAELVQKVIGWDGQGIGKEDQKTGGMTHELARDVAGGGPRLAVADRGVQRIAPEAVRAHRQDDDSGARLDFLAAGQHTGGTAPGDEIGSQGLLDRREHLREMGPVGGGDEHQTPVGSPGAAFLQGVPRGGARRRNGLRFGRESDAGIRGHGPKSIMGAPALRNRGPRAVS